MHERRSALPPETNGFDDAHLSNVSLYFCMNGTPAMNAIRIPAIAPPAMYPDAINTPGLLSPSATSCSSLRFTPLNFFRTYRSDNQRTMPPMKIGLDDDSGR